MGDTLDVVQPVDTNDKLDSFELARQSGDALLDLWLLKRLDKLLWVDTDGERADRDKLAIDLDAVGCGPLRPRIRLQLLKKWRA